MRAFFEYNDGYIHETGCSLKIIVKEGTPETDRIPALKFCDLRAAVV